MSKFPEYKHEKSQEWFNRALDAIPSGVYGHLGPSEGLFLPITKWPLMSDHAKGTYFWDVDGNKYLDFMCAYGPNVLGYCDDDVDKAAMEQLKRGNCTTSPSYKMVECAELLKDTVAMADWAFFMKNGSDATTFSVMCARAHTGKKKMMFFKGYYHGDFQWAQKIDYPGILPEEVENNIVVPWFDMDAMQEAYDACGGDVAGLIAQPYDHGNFFDNVCATKEQWAKVLDIILDRNIFPNIEQSARLKASCRENMLTQEEVRNIMLPEQVLAKPRKVTFKADRLDDYFDEGYTEEKITEVIINLLDEWKKRCERA